MSKGVNFVEKENELKIPVIISDIIKMLNGSATCEDLQKRLSSSSSQNDKIYRVILDKITRDEIKITEDKFYILNQSFYKKDNTMKSEDSKDRSSNPNTSVDVRSTNTLEGPEQKKTRNSSVG
jgi:DNA-binding FrmR family transcriptional regulator